MAFIGNNQSLHLSLNLSRVILFSAENSFFGRPTEFQYYYFENNKKSFWPDAYKFSRKYTTFLHNYERAPFHQWFHL